VAKHNWFVADSVNPLDRGPTARNDGDRFSDCIVIPFPYDEKTYLTALPRKTPGLRPNDDWDNIGQCLTVSFDNVVFPKRP
jgi:hypothetical protein